MHVFTINPTRQMQLQCARQGNAWIHAQERESEKERESARAHTHKAREIVAYTYTSDSVVKKLPPRSRVSKGQERHTQHTDKHRHRYIYTCTGGS